MILVFHLLFADTHLIVFLFIFVYILLKTGSQRWPPLSRHPLSKYFKVSGAVSDQIAEILLIQIMVLVIVVMVMVDLL